jgi:hypothetical protein
METVIETGTFNCQADLNDAAPTCGWQYDEAEEKITHS